MNNVIELCNNVFPNFQEDFYYSHFINYKPLNLSNFQKWAIKSIVDNDNVLITAHTGSGKTLPAEFAINYFHKLNKKVIYASPIKALSNQKLYDMRKKYPHISFGLLTGDCKDNPEADVLIMTTEILRNTLFNKRINSKNKTSVPLSFDIDIENELAAVIFDEVHYINDVERGSVWEQSILLLPPQIQLIMLSATIDRPEDFATWIFNEKQKQSIESALPIKKMYLTSTYERVVPLTHYMWVTVHSGTIKKASKTPYEKKLEDIHNRPLVIADSKGEYNETNYYKVKDILDYNYKHNIYVKRQFVLDGLLRHLKQNNMLPAICFIFSRKQVEQAANECGFCLFEEDSGIPSIIEKECQNILMQKLSNYKEYIELPEYKKIVSLLEKGIAIHHAGIMPVLREMIELLFEKGYIKLLFATETFAVGINMPTKTVIFAGLSKFNGSIIRTLFPHEYTQMAGRAGRRGIDTIGHVFHCNNLFEIPSSVNYKNMLTGPPQKLTSKFKISFNLALNILASNNGGDKEMNILEQFTNKSLLSTDINNELLCYSREKKEVMDLLEQTTKQIELCRTPKNVLLKYKDLEQTIQQKTNSARKKIRIELNSLETEHKFLQNDMKHLDALLTVETLLKKNEGETQNTIGYISNIIYCVEHILETNNFIDKTKNLTKKGEIASQLQEVHPLVLADAYSETDGFSGFTSIELAALFACFNNIHVSDEVKSHSPTSNSGQVNKCATFMKERLEYYFDLETKHIIDTGSPYDINFDIQRYITEWCLSKDEADCKEIINNIKAEKNIFLGDFIKAILKINNICAEFEKICEMNEDIQLLEKIRKIPQQTLKYVVTNQSLYI